MTKNSFVAKVLSSKGLVVKVLSRNRPLVTNLQAQKGKEKKLLRSQQSVFIFNPY